MSIRDFRDKMKGKVLEHNLGFHVTVVEMDPSRESDTHWSSKWAYCRYVHHQTGDLQVASFAAWEFKEGSWPEEKEDD